MIIFNLCINAIAVITCLVAAVMSFRRDNTVVGVCMMLLSMVNLMLFASTAGRLI